MVKNFGGVQRGGARRIPKPGGKVTSGSNVTEILFERKKK